MNERLPIFITQEIYFTGISVKNVIFDKESDVTRIKSTQEDGGYAVFYPMDAPENIRIGTLIKVRQVMTPAPHLATVIFDTIGTAKFDLAPDDNSMAINVRRVDYVTDDSPMVRALEKRLLSKYAELEELLSTTGFVHTPDMDDINMAIDFIADSINSDNIDLYFSENTEDRLVMLCGELEENLDIERLEERVGSKVQEAMDQNQREYYVREQIKALSEEIDEEDESGDFLKKIDVLNVSDDIKDKLKKDVKRLNRMQASSPEAAIMKNYLDFVTELPWGVLTEDNDSLENAKKVLDEDHYGIKKVKERLIESLAVRKLSPETKSPIICLYGPPGVGKTSIARSIARAMNKKYVRLSFGGVRDEAEIRGHRKTYVGAMPGRIISSIHSVGSSNPVFLMDEIDKMAADYKGDPASALLEVLDPEQNVNFRDHYLELPFDLSKVLFITTANSLDPISAPLLDRMELIEMSGYTEDEKLEIAKRHIVKKSMKENGIEDGWVTVSDSAIKEIISKYTRESGVRKLEQRIGQIMRKVAVVFVENRNAPCVKVTKSNLEKFLGKPVYNELKVRQDDKVGVANGLAWTSVGGTMLEIEGVLIPGKGNIQLTGNLGKVMEESAKAAFSYVKTIASDYGVSEDIFKDHDVHVHAPEGAIPKDGPSAGITMTSVILSAVTGMHIKHDVAMTGEISLVGDVLPIGGLKEKTLAALRNGMKKVVIPYDNKKDYEELPDVVKRNIEFTFAKTYSDVYPVVFGK